MKPAWKGYNRNKSASSDLMAFVVSLFKTNFLRGKCDQEIAKTTDRS